MLLESPIGVPKFEKGVVSSPKARRTEIMGDGEGLHALSGGLGISGHIKKPQSVLTECLSDTMGSAYGPPRHFKGAKIQTYYPLLTSKVCSSFSSACTPLIDLCSSSALELTILCQTILISP